MKISRQTNFKLQQWLCEAYGWRDLIRAHLTDLTKLNLSVSTTAGCDPMIIKQPTLAPLTSIHQTMLINSWRGPCYFLPRAPTDSRIATNADKWKSLEFNITTLTILFQHLSICYLA